MPLEIFSGWKEIASYLRKGVRTVQRYERELGLPIHRPNGKTVGAVMAAKKELDDWVSAAPTAAPAKVHSKRKLWPAEKTNKLGAQFLQIDCEVALTFSSIALGTSNEEKRRRATQTARNGFNTIKQLRKKIVLTDEETDKLDAGLRRLKTELQMLGASF
jgi:hypothetical protein